ncbi:AAA family ATPase, partial [Arthrobacter sp. GCM10027362]|uniref:AAA family ATPase n=1 Tax=Arthrobacter sp. GCM10027362 TaxID=3273379 RepID=UPI0036396572
MIEEFGSGLLVGREDVLAEVRASILGPGGGALLVAEPGMGKSAVAQAVVAGLGDAVHPLWIHAGPELTGIPFGALVPHLGPMTASEADSVLAAMRSLMAGMRRSSTDGKPVLMVIDDVQDLDDNSAVLVAQLVSSGAAKLLALGRTKPAAPRELLSLAADQLLTRHTLRPLDRPEADRLCRTVLGGPVLASSSAALRDAAGGIPLFVLALLAQARRSGALAEHNGVWVLTGEPGPPGARLADLVQAQLGNHSAGAREALETIALAEPLPLPVLLGTTAGACLDELVEAGVITVSEDARRLVRTAHPLYAEVVRNRIPASRSLRLRGRIVAATGSGGPAGESLLRQVDWSLDRGLEVPDRLLLRAARLANDGLDSRMALRAATAVKSAVYRAAAQVQIGRAYADSGDYGRAAAATAGLLEQSRDLLTAGSATLLRVRLWMQGKGPETLEEIAGRWSEAIERIAASDSGGRYARLAAWSRTGVQLMRLAVKVAEGDYGPAEAGLAAIGSQPEGFAECTLAAKVLAAEIRIATGRVESGTRLSARALDMLRRRGARLLPFCEAVAATHVLGLIRQGSTLGIHEVLAAFPGSVSGSQVQLGAAASLAAAAAAVGQARYEAGLSLLKTAIEALEVADSQRLLPPALAAGAYTAALAGDGAAADAYLARFSALGPVGRAQ